ncbi:MAG: IS200/IS605 family transposase [Bacteroidales bacterium]|jgi:REP element-mobilizing transposase RayT|nr:IS200/IS605 family transposase [Bacteroidales bacterium]
MKPNTYTKLYAHCIFTPKGRNSLLTETIRDKVHKYIYGIIIGKKCFPLAINGTSDHIHILVGFLPTIAISDLVRDIKRSSALFINEHLKSYLRFSWQEGYGAFTVGYRELDKVFKYILNQEIHHTKENFKNEYLQILNDEGIKYDPSFLFEFYV